MSDSMPMIFQTSNLTYEDRYCVFWNVILENCRPDEVTARCAKYAAQNVCQSGWKSVWRSSPKSSGCERPFDVVVEVTNVNADNLTAEITICEPVVSDCPSLKVEKVAGYLSSNNFGVPLVELFPVYDESGEHDGTALAIEHLRFFYEHIWREWDEDDDGDYSYAARHLESRLRLYYDMQDGSIPKESVQRYQATYEQYKQKLSELNSLREQMSTSDFEQDLDELDVLRCAEKSEECEALVHSLQMMENPQMRNLFTIASPGVRSILLGPKGPRPEGEKPVTIIVAGKLEARMVKHLSDDMVIEHQESLEVALSEYFAGDTILVHPGRHTLVGSYILADSVTICGAGKRDEVTVVCEEVLECCGEEIRLRNVVLEQVGSDSAGIVSVKKGRTLFQECDINCSTVGATVEQDAELSIEKCKIYGAREAGVVVNPGGTLDVEDCTISGRGSKRSEDGQDVNSDETGIQLHVRSDSDKSLKATVRGCTITNHNGFGICVVKDKNMYNSSDDPRQDIHLELDENKLGGNGSGEIGQMLI